MNSPCHPTRFPGSNRTSNLCRYRLHCGEMVHAYKRDPAVYRFALDRLALDPRRTLMVAAHPWDLRAAAGHGLRTAYIERAGEGAPEPSDTFDLTVPDLAALAASLLTKA
jgi:2-haloacid dehalogenase